MEPLAIALGNVLITFWIVGGFLALLLLLRNEPAAVTAQGIELPPPPAPGSTEIPRPPVAINPAPESVPDVYWERRRPEPADRPEEAA